MSNEKLGADELLNQIKEPQQVSIPDAPEGWQEILKPFFGEEIPEQWDSAYQTLARYKEVDSLQSQLDEYNSKVQALEEQSKLSPFHNEFSAKIDTMLRQGADLKEVVRFGEAQLLDPSAMSDEEKIKFMMKKQNPAATVSEIDAFFDRKYKPEVDEDGNPTNTAEVNYQKKLDAQQAAKMIEELKVSFDNPDAKKAKEQAEQSRQLATQEWGKVLDASLFTKPMPLTVKVEGQDPFSLDVNATDKEKGMYLKEALSFAVNNSIPLNKDGWAQVEKFAQNMFFVKNMENILREVASAAITQTTQKLSGKKPPQEEKEKIPKTNPYQVAAGEHF